MAYLYVHQRLDTNVIFYVGISDDKNFKRAHSKQQRSEFWLRIIDKTNYEVIILIDNITKQEACLLEIGLIEYYGRKNLKKGSLVNLTDGGIGPKNKYISEKTREKLKNRKYPKYTEARLEKAKITQQLLADKIKTKNIKYLTDLFIEENKIGRVTQKSLAMKANLSYATVRRHWKSILKNINVDDLFI